MANAERRSAGATGLNAAVQTQVLTLSWRYLPTVLASSLIMLGWALFINNVGRRRYPLHWWAAGATFVHDEDNCLLGKAEAGEMRREEVEEGELERESGAANETLSQTTNWSQECHQNPPQREKDCEKILGGPSSLQSAINATGEFSN